MERTLRGHLRCIILIRSSGDGTERVWSVETWKCVQTVKAYPTGLGQCIKALAVCGAALVGGSGGGSASEEREVRVWDLATLRPLLTLRQPAGAIVESLVWDWRDVWGAVKSQVVVWGRRGVTGGGA